MKRDLMNYGLIPSFFFLIKSVCNQIIALLEKIVSREEFLVGDTAGSILIFNSSPSDLKTKYEINRIAISQY